MLLDNADVADAIVGFHAQQAVEKALKAALAVQAVEFPYTHDLDGLLELCRSAGVEPPLELAGVEELSPFGVTFRYGTLDPPSLDRRAAARRAEIAVAWGSDTIANAS